MTGLPQRRTDMRQSPNQGLEWTKLMSCVKCECDNEDINHRFLTYCAFWLIFGMNKHKVGSLWGSGSC